MLYGMDKEGVFIRPILTKHEGRPSLFDDVILLGEPIRLSWEEMDSEIQEQIVEISESIKFAIEKE